MGIGKISAAEFFSEQVRLTPLTSDPTDSEEGELWLRADLAEEDDQLATLRLDTGGSTVDIPVFDVAADVPDGIETQLRLVVDDQQGFVPTTADDPAIEQLGVWSGGVRYGVAEGLSALPDGATRQWEIIERSNDTIIEQLDDDNGVTVGNPTNTADDNFLGGYYEKTDGEDDAISLPINEWQRLWQTEDWGYAFTFRSTDFENTLHGAVNEDFSHSWEIVEKDGGKFEIRTQQNDEAINVETDENGFGDGDIYRVFCSIKTSDPNNWQLYVNGNEEPLTVEGYDTAYDMTELVIPVDMHFGGAFREESGLTQTTDLDISNVMLYDSPEREDITSDYQQHPFAE